MYTHITQTVQRGRVSNRSFYLFHQYLAHFMDFFLVGKHFEGFQGSDRPNSQQSNIYIKQDVSKSMINKKAKEAIQVKEKNTDIKKRIK